jgi:homoserine dehydrogenase
VARNRVTGSRGAGESAYADLPILSMGEVRTRYHLALDVADQPGVLAAVAGAFAEEHVSISTVRQEGRGSAATLVLVTHAASDAALARTVERLSAMPAVRRVAGVLRVEGMAGE